MASPRSSERAFALQKYLLLHSQHDALQKHLDHINTSHSISPSQSRHSSISSSLSSSPDESFFSSSPINNHRRSGSIQPQRTRPELRQRRSSLPTVIDETILNEIEDDENKLKDVNLQIKSTLTELLNCESVRGDRRYRMWVQTRLMDAERELKGERMRSCERRRGSNGEMMV